MHCVGLMRRSDRMQPTRIPSLQMLHLRRLIILDYSLHSRHSRLPAQFWTGISQPVPYLYLLYKSQKRPKTTRCRVCIHEVVRWCTELGEFHCLLQESRLDDDRFQRYLRLTGAQFEDLLARVGARISRLDTKYRRSISSAERLSICLRWVAVSYSTGCPHTATISFSSIIALSNRKQPHMREVTSSAWTRRWLDVAARCCLKSCIFSTLFVSLQTLHSCHARCSIRAADSRIACHRAIYIDFQCRVAAPFASIAFGLNAP